MTPVTGKTFKKTTIFLNYFDLPWRSGCGCKARMAWSRRGPSCYNGPFVAEVSVLTRSVNCAAVTVLAERGRPLFIGSTTGACCCCLHGAGPVGGSRGKNVQLETQWHLRGFEEALGNPLRDTLLTHLTLLSSRQITGGSGSVSELWTLSCSCSSAARNGDVRWR